MSDPRRVHKDLAEISALIETISAAEQRLKVLTAGQVDVVQDQASRHFMLQVSHQRSRESEAVNQTAILDALPGSAALIDVRGEIVAINAAWRRFASDNGLSITDAGVGLNYLDVCDASFGHGAVAAGAVAAGVRSVLSRAEPSFQHEYSCHAPAVRRWFKLVVAPLTANSSSGAVVMHLDITERIKAQHSAELLRAVVDGAPDIVFVKDRAGRYLLCNAAFARFIGKDVEDMMGKDLVALGRGKEELMNPDRATAQFEADIEVMSTGQPVSLEDVLEGVEGPRTFLVNKAPYLDEHGQIAGVIGIGRDTTERKRAEVALVESQALLSMAGRLAGVGSWYVDLPPVGIKWSDVLAAMHEEPVGFSPTIEQGLAYYATEYRQRVSDAFRRCVSDGTPFDLECELITAQGKRVWVHAIGEALRNSNGKICRVQGALQDVSERKRAELQIRQLAARVTSTLESITDGFVALDPQWRYVFANDEALRMLRRSRDTLIGRVIWDEYPEIVGTEVEHHYRQAVLDNKTSKFQIFYGPWNEWLSIQCYPSEVGLAIHFRDITQQRRDQDDLRDLNADLEVRVAKRTEELNFARDGAEQASRAKSAFLATMSHEIRTPMNGVIGMIDVLGQSNLKPSQADILRTARDSAYALLRIVDDVLDFSKIEAGHFQIDHEPFAIEPVVAQVRDTLDHLALSKDVSLYVEVDFALPTQVIGDAARLRQVLLNLVGNAIKFSSGSDKQGKVEVRVLARERTGDTCTIEFLVADNGIGMDHATQSRLFTPFTQGDDSTTKKFGGTGLGLSISGRLVAMMGGAIRVHSEPGQGSQFVVRLPFEQAVGEPAPRGTGFLTDYAEHDRPHFEAETLPAPLSAIDASEAGRLILVAEDNNVNQLVIRKQLALLGYSAQIVGDGKEALAHVRSGDYSLLLSDLHMPHMDGYELAAAIRREETGGKHLPIIALTANALKGEAGRCKESGMDDYMTKPLQLVDLQTMLRRWMPLDAKPLLLRDAKPRRTDEHRKPTNPSDLQSAPVADLKVLIELVGDEPSVLHDMLKAFVSSAQNAASAIRRGVAESDGKGVARAAHTLKSGARSIGAMRLGDLCDEMESSGVSKKSDLSALLGRFEAELAEVLRFLQSVTT